MGCREGIFLFWKIDKHFWMNCYCQDDFGWHCCRLGICFSSMLPGTLKSQFYYVGLKQISQINRLLFNLLYIITYPILQFIKNTKKNTQNKMQDRQHYDHLFKIILAGDTSVGKTNLVQAFNRLTQKTKQRSSQNMGIGTNIAPTIGVEFSTRIVDLQNRKRIKTQIWDTDLQLGKNNTVRQQQRNDGCNDRHYRKALGALVVYDITKEKTFHNVKRWIESIREQADPNIVIFLVGNKIDQRAQQQVNPADARKFANNEGIFFQETSALTSENVHQTFIKLIQEIYKRVAEKEALNQVSTGRQGHRLTVDHGNKGIQDKCQC